MTVLKFYPDAPAAQMAKSILEAHGIRSFVADEALASVDPPVVFATGGVRLMIDEADVENAQKVLREQAESMALPDDFVPPECDEKEASPSSS